MESMASFIICAKRPAPGRANFTAKGSETAEETAQNMPEMKNSAHRRTGCGRLRRHSIAEKYRQADTAVASARR